MWYYTQNGETHGPVTADDIRELIATKTLTKGEFVYHKEHIDWSPIKKHFEVEFYKLEGEQPNPWRPLCIALAIISAGIIGAIYKEHLRILLIISSALLIFIPICIAMASVRFMRLAKLLKAAGNIWQAFLCKIAGVIGYTIIFLAVFLPIISGALITGVKIYLKESVKTDQEVAEANKELLQQFDELEIPKKRREAKAFITDGDSWGSAIVKRLSKERKARNIEKIIVRNDKFSISAAAEIAQAANYANLPIYAEKECNAGCAYLLIAANNSYAEWDMNFRFKINDEDMQKPYSQDPAVIRARILAYDGSTPSRSTYTGSALGYTVKGLLSGVTLNGENIDLNTGLQKAIERRTNRLNLTDRDIINNYITASLSTKYEYKDARILGGAYNKLMSRDVEGFRQSLIPLSFIDIRGHYIPASNEDTLNYAFAVQAIAKELAKTEKWRACEQLVNQSARLDLAALHFEKQELLTKYFDATSQLLATKYGKKGPTHIMHSKTAEVIPELVEAFNYIGSLQFQGDDVLSQKSCLTALEIFDAMDQAPSKRHAALMYNRALAEGF